MELAQLPAVELEELIVPNGPTETSEEEPEEQPKERQIPELGLNLGAMILQLAIEDYCGADEREHRSAALFLFPKTKPYADRLTWAISQTELALHPTRRQLEALRGLWDAEREKRKP